jgi:hypothetical protein
MNLSHTSRAQLKYEVQVNYYEEEKKQFEN